LSFQVRLPVVDPPFFLYCLHVHWTMTLARPRFGPRVCHVCLWLLWGTCTLAERGDRARQNQKLELDILQADQQGTPAQRKLDANSSSSDQQRLTGAGRAAGMSNVQVGAQAVGCVIAPGTNTIQVRDFDIPADASSRRTQCLENGEFSSLGAGGTVKLSVPLPPNIPAHELTCTKSDEYWTCGNACSFEILLGRSKGQPEFNGPPDMQNYFWCQISSVKYHMHQCPDNERGGVVARAPGWQVAAAAVKTCESMGYLHQNLNDGATRYCLPNGGGDSVGLFLRTIGLMTTGMSYYMEQQGFAPTNHNSDDSTKSWNETKSLEVYCKGVEDAKKATLAMVFSPACKTETTPGWASTSNAQRQEFQDCSDRDTLGSCYRKLGGPSNRANCAKFHALEKLLFNEQYALGGEPPNKQVLDLMQPSPACTYKTKDLWWAAAMGGWTRRSEGITNPRGQLIKPSFPKRYCRNRDANEQEAGEACSQTEGEKCAAGKSLHCLGGKCCLKDKSADRESHCCPGYLFDNTKYCYKPVAAGEVCTQSMQCPGNAYTCGSMSGAKKCCGVDGATEKCCDTHQLTGQRPNKRCTKRR